MPRQRNEFTLNIINKKERITCRTRLDFKLVTCFLYNAPDPSHVYILNIVTNKKLGKQNNIF